MAVDTSIALQSRAPNILGALQQGLQVGGMFADLRNRPEQQARAEEERQLRLAQIRQQQEIGAAQLAQFEQKKAQAQQAAQSAQEKMRIIEAGSLWDENGKDITNGNYSKVLGNLRQRKSLLQKQGVTDTPIIDGAIAALDSRDPKAILEIQETGAGAKAFASRQGWLTEKADTIVKGSDIVNGWVVSLKPDGSLTSKRVPNYVADQSKEVKAALDLEEDKEGVTTRIRGEINKEIQPYTQRRESAITINNILKGKGGVNDVALTTAFFKIMDPGSTVTQQEAAQVAANRNLPDRFLGMFDKVTKGEALSDTERVEIAKFAQNQFKDFETKAKSDVVRLLNIPNQDKRFGGGFTSMSVMGASLDDLFTAEGIAPEKLKTESSKIAPTVTEQSTQDTGISIEQFRAMTPQQRAETIQRLRQQ